MQAIVPPEFLSQSHPGYILMHQHMKPNAISQSRLARDIDVPQSRIAHLCNGTRAITADTALRLAAFFGTTAEYWMELQSAHDLKVARATAWPDQEKRIRPLNMETNS